ncbi:MAG: Ultraviolet N-glycosylase/AP lyase [Actinomycetota bacterium]
MAKKTSNRRKPDPAQAAEILRLLRATYPDADCELNFNNPFQLLVATVLSAQCTDARVNDVTKVLFKRYPKPKDLASADRADLEEIIKSTGFFRAKANSLLGLANKLVTDYNSEVPVELDELVKLPGVGRKTANVVRGEAFDLPGLTVDTHFGRLVRRFGWTTETDPVKVEFAIADLFDPKDWTNLSQTLIWHGRRRCHARKPACGACPVADLCPSFGAGPTEPDVAQKLVKS